MSVLLREKELSNGKLSLYLDIYYEGKRQYRFLKLYLYAKPKNQVEKNQNKEIRLKAEKIRIKTENELIDNNYKLLGVRGSNIYFLDYFKELTEQRKKSIGNYGNWEKIIIFTGLMMP